jgi:multiple antibiotic resistance protein
MLAQFALVFIGLFVALDVVGLLPMFTSITQGMAPKVRQQTADRSIAVALGLAVGFIFLGEAVFRALGITLPDFKIAGGIVLLLVSLADLLGSPEATKRASGESGVVPLAVPLITGPAVLTTLVFQAKTFGYPLTLVSLVLNYLIAWVVIRNSQVVRGLIGKDGMVVVSKIAALLLAAISVSMIRSGVVETISTLSGK